MLSKITKVRLTVMINHSIIVIEHHEGVSTLRARKWLIDMRSERNLTHEQVAEMAGIERSHYTKIENGSSPSVRVAKKIARVFGFDWAIFFKESCDETSQNRATGTGC